MRLGDALTKMPGQAGSGWNKFRVCMAFGGLQPGGAETYWVWGTQEGPKPY